MKNPAVFLDRDGVLIKEKSYLSNINDVEFFPGAIIALKSLNPRFLKVVVSNQSGISRGYYTSQDVLNIQAFLDRQLGEEGVEIADWYFCPHSPDDDCQCRKPRTGLFQKAAREHSLNLETSWMIGDKSTDIQAGHSIGARTILVQTGYAGAEPGAAEVFPDYIAADLLEAIKIINHDSNYKPFE